MIGDRIKRWGKKLSGGVKKAIKWGKKAAHKVAKWGKKIYGGAKKAVHWVAGASKKAVDYAKKNLSALKYIPGVGEIYMGAVKAGQTVADVSGGLDNAISHGGSIDKAGSALLKSGKSGLDALKSGNVNGAITHFKDVKNGLNVAKTSVISNEQAAKLTGLYQKAIKKKGSA